MDIPAHLEAQVRDGRVVLILGAGASREAQGPDGRTVPNADELAVLLANQFLGGK